MTVTPPTGCVLCGSPPAGAWHVPSDPREWSEQKRKWNVSRVLVLCEDCAESRATCVDLPGRERGVPASPFVGAEDLSLLIDCGVCWCEREASAIVPWCPRHGVNESAERAVRECPACRGEGRNDMSPPDGPGPRYQNCSDCEATGRIQRRVRKGFQ